MTPAGVVVLGMHRSGTSAITRMINLLGVPTCIATDLVRDRTGNLRGHWESSTLVRYNEELFEEAGAAWWCPPPLDTDWTAMAGRRIDGATQAFAGVHNTPSWVWKDPRTCVTAPFWRAVLAQPLTYLLVVRHPLAVAASLTARNNLTTEGGIALWEGYTARAARAAIGAPVLVCSYEAMVADPLGFAASAQEFLLSHNVELETRGSRVLAAQFVQDALTHHRGTHDPTVFSNEQEALLETMTELVGPHDSFQPVLPPVTMTTERLFDERRAMLAPSQERHESPFVPSGIQLLKRAPARSEAAPSISVIVVPRSSSADTGPTVAAVRSTAPDSAEVIVHRPTGGRAQSINAALEAAHGDIVVLCDSTIVPNPGWPEVLCDALKRSDAGVVGPALVRDGDEASHGLTFRDACLNMSWVKAPPTTVTAFPVAVLPGAMMAFRREVIDAVGGFDSGMMADSSGEDAELCMRLWRAGYMCLAVPQASALIRDGGTGSGVDDPIAFLHNRLRLGALHLSPPRLRRFLEPFRRSPYFAEAFARVLSSDLGSRRALVNAISCFDDEWYLNHFGIRALEEHTVDASQNRKDNELVRT